MKKPALIETTVRLFPNKELVTATTRTTVKSRITDPLLYCPFSIFSNALATRTSIHTGLVSKPGKKQARQFKQKRFFDSWTKGISILPDMVFAES
jgi:hypothetical protein